MTLRLFPRLPRHVARELAASLSTAPAVAAAELAAPTHESAVYAPTGGHRITEKELGALADEVRALAEKFGFPMKPTQSHASSFDGQCAVHLHKKWQIHPTEAAREEVWSFLGCVLMPDIVRWRWGGKATPADRFLGGDRGLRNTFGRLWWRAHLLKDEWWEEKDPYELVWILGEDEIVGFVERPRAVVSRLTAVAIAREVTAARRAGMRVTRTDLLRDVMKRFLRRGVLITYEGLSPDEMRDAAEVLVSESLTALRRQRRMAS